MFSTATLRSRTWWLTSTLLFGALGFDPRLGGPLRSHRLYGGAAHQGNWRAGWCSELTGDRSSAWCCAERFWQAGISLGIGIPAAIGVGKLISNEVFGVARRMRSCFLWRQRCWGLRLSPQLSFPHTEQRNWIPWTLSGANKNAANLYRQIGLRESTDRGLRIEIKDSTILHAGRDCRFSSLGCLFAISNFVRPDRNPTTTLSV